MPKYATIGDYWDEEMVSKVTQLLQEYQDLFLTKFSNMKGIIVVAEDILSWIEDRIHVKDGTRKCRMPLLWRSQSHYLCQRRKDLWKLKIQPLEEIKIGGVGTLPVLTSCINEILENLPPFR